MFQLENRAGISFTKDKIHYVELVHFNNEFILDTIDETYFTEELSFEHDKEVKINAIIQTAFNEITTRNKIKSKSLFVSLPAEVFQIHRLPIDNTLLEQDLLLQFRWEFGILYPQFNADELSIQYFEIPSKQVQAPKYAIAAAVNRKYLRIARNFAQKNKFTLVAADYAHFSSDSSLLLNYQTAKDGYNLSIYLDDTHLSFELLYQGKPIYLQMRNFSSYSEVTSIIIKELQVLQSMQIPTSSISNAFVFGDSITPVLIESWEKNTGLKYYPVNPFKKITVASKLADSKLLREHFFKFSAAAGICFRLA